MLEQAIDLWEVETDVRCITTNGTVTSRGLNVMGGGCALEARNRYNWLPISYGEAISKYGNHVYLFAAPGLIMFPTKEDVKDPSKLTTIVRSAHELVKLADIYGWERVALPRPGAGLGGLKWEDVKKILEPILDDRFIIIDFPG